MIALKTRYTSLAYILFTLLFISLVSAQASERVYLDISTTKTRKINIAVPWFQNINLPGTKQRLGRDLADIFAKALKFHGIVSILPTAEYGGIQHANWKKYGLDYAVLGQYTISSDTVKLEMKLFDVAGNEFILGKRFTSTMSKKDKILFKFCDSVIKTLTGMQGISDTRIAFVNQRNNTKEVFLTDVLGRKFKQVTRHKHLTVSPRFVPGGPYLTYSSYHSGNQNLYITDLRQNKTTRALSRRKGLNLAPAWSSDGRRMIITLSKSGNPDLFMLDGQGNIIEQMTSRSGINVSPTWSPDRRYVVFVSDRSGSPQLYLMDLRSKKQRRITYEGTENAEPHWSPTENRIVYSSLRGGVYQLFSMNPLTDDPPQQLTTDLSHHESPRWSPDGNQVIFAKRDGKKKQIYGILRNGSYQRRLFTLQGSQTYPQWAR